MPVLSKKQVERIDAEYQRLRMGVLALDELLRKRDAEIAELRREVEELHEKLRRKEDETAELREDEGYA